MKKNLFFFSVLTMTAVSLSGCASPNAGNSPSSASPEPGSTQSPLEISMMLPVFTTDYPKDDGPVVQEIDKRTNTKLHFEWVPNASYNDKFNITLASGKMPSIVYVPSTKTPGFVNAAKAGAFWEIGSYLKDYKNLSQANPVILNNTSIDGKIYGIYRGRPLGRNGIAYRKDWLENVGLQPPKTIDDFYAMLKAFKEKDPDRNGKNDTYGLVLVKWTGQWASGFDTIKLWFGAPNKWGIVDDKLIPEHETPEYLEALKFMKKLYDEKLINQDFAVFDSSKWTDPVVNNEAGVIVDVVDTGARIDDKIHAALASKGKDDPNVSYVDVLGGVTGKSGLRTLPTSGYAGILSISKSSVKTEDELKRILAFLDQTNEPEMQTLIGSGLEGRHYTKESDYIVSLTKDTAMHDAELGGLGQMLTYIPEDRALHTKQSPLRIKQAEIMKENEKYIVPNPTEPFISEVYSQKGQQLDNIINNARLKYIVGQMDEAGLQAAFDLWRKSGGTDLVKEMNDLYAASIQK